MMLVMVETPTVRTDGQLSPGQPLSLEESQDRLKHLVEGEINVSGSKEAVTAGKEKEHAVAYQSEQQKSAQEKRKEEEKSPIGETSLPSTPTQQDIGITKQGDDDDEMSDEEQELALKKAPLREAIKWLAAWLRRKKKKMGFGL